MSDSSEQKLFFHKPVLVREVLEYLNPQQGKEYIDVTFGSGGHTKALLSVTGTKVTALDWDKTSLDTYGPLLEQEFNERIRLVQGNFADLYKIVKKNGIHSVDGILADFGTSQMQIIDRAGFSVFRDTPLDMRMSPGHQRTTAAHILNYGQEEELLIIFSELGEERYAKQLAHAIVAARQEKPLRTTADLVAIVERIVPRSSWTHIHPATRIFQALRMQVNHELDNIKSFLPTAIGLLKPGGRLACISFHSLEDRIVKHYFREQEYAGKGTVITTKVITAQQDELAENPSARSAKLRVFEKI